MTIPQEVADTIVDPKAYADGRIYESYAWLPRQRSAGGSARGELIRSGSSPGTPISSRSAVRTTCFIAAILATTIVDKATDDHVRKQTGMAAQRCAVWCRWMRRIIEISRPDPELVHAAQHREASYPQHRPCLGRAHGHEGWRVRFRPRGCPPLSAPCRHGDSGRAGERRAAHVDADPGIVRRDGS